MVKLLGKKSVCCKAPLVQARTQIYCSSCGINPSVRRRNKFTPQDVVEMKRLYDVEHWSSPQIGMKYHAHHTTILLLIGHINKKNKTHMPTQTAEQKVDRQKQRLISTFVSLYGIKPTERMLEQYERNRDHSHIKEKIEE